MNPDRLLVRREPDKSFTLLGKVVRESGGNLTVITPSGEEATFPKRGHILLPFGSIFHLANLHPSLLADAFDHEPRAVLEQVLIDAKSALTSGQIKGKLAQAGIPSESIDRQWADLRTVLTTSPDIRAQGKGQAARFEWKAERSSRLTRYLQTDELPGTRDAPATDADGTSPLPGDAPTAGPERAVGAGPRAAVPMQETSPERSEAPTHPEDALVTALAATLGASAPNSRKQIAASVLRVGESLSAVADKNLAPLLALQGEARDLANVLLLARDREHPTLRGVALRLTPAAVQAWLSTALSEVGDPAQADEAILRRFRLFVSRLLSHADVTALPLALALGAFVHVAQTDPASEPSGPTISVAEALAERVESSTQREWDEVASGITDLARHSRRLPLIPGGARSRLLAALYALHPDLVARPVFWRDVGIRDISAVAGAELRHAFSSREFARKIAEPVIAQHLESLSTRQALASILTLPGTLTEFVDADALVRAMERVSRNDKVFNTWFRELRQVRELEDAIARGDQFRGQAVLADSRAQQLTQELEELQAALDAANASLNDVRRANEHTRQAGNRQAKVDTLRSLATVALAVKQSHEATQDAALGQRVDFAVRREGLTPIGAVGEVVAFDPALHDALGEHLDPGSPVSVLRPGYTYAAGDHALALIKAQVHST